MDAGLGSFLVVSGIMFVDVFRNTRSGKLRGMDILTQTLYAVAPLLIGATGLFPALESGLFWTALLALWVALYLGLRSAGVRAAGDTTVPERESRAGMHPADGEPRPGTGDALRAPRTEPGPEAFRDPGAAYAEPQPESIRDLRASQAEADAREPRSSSGAPEM